MYIRAESATGAFETILNLLSEAPECSPRGLKIKEIVNCCIEISNPLNRIVQTVERKFNLSYAVGELLWYLSGRNDLEMMQYYSTRMAQNSDDGFTLNSAYGYRIFGQHKQIGFNQWNNVKKLLSKDPDSRQAIIHLHTPNNQATKDEVCTLSLQFLIRDGKLDMITTMRSNDLCYGFVYDVFSFTMLQEIMANELRVKLGKYYHNVGSMHVYENDFGLTRQFTITKNPFIMKRNMMRLEDYEHLIRFEDYRRCDDGYTHVSCVSFPDESIIEQIFAYALELWKYKRKSDVSWGEDEENFAAGANELINKVRLLDENYADLITNYCGLFHNTGIKIIVDGIDAAGKSTLIAALNKKFLEINIRFNVQKFKKPTDSFRFPENYISLIQNDVNIIFDRFFMSEYIYGISMDRAVNLNAETLHNLLDKCRKKEVIFVIFAFGNDKVPEVISRMGRTDQDTYSKVAFQQNFLYEYMARIQLNQYDKKVVINDPNYNIDEVVGQILELLVGEVFYNARPSQT